MRVTGGELTSLQCSADVRSEMDSLPLWKPGTPNRRLKRNDDITSPDGVAVAGLHVQPTIRPHGIGDEDHKIVNH